MSEEPQTAPGAAPGSPGRAASGVADITDGRGRVIFPATVMVATGIGTLALGVVFFATEVFAASPAQVGFLAATWSFCYIVGCLVCQRVADRLAPHRSMVLAATVMGGSVVLLLVCPRVLALAFLCYAVYGLGTALFWPPLMGWLSSGLEGERLNRVMGRFNLCWSSGAIVGPVVAGVLAREDPRLPVAAAGVLYLGAAGYTAAVSRRAGVPPARRALGGRDPGADPADEDRSTPLRYPAWTGLVAAYLALGVINTVFPLEAQARLGLGKPLVGGLMLVRALFTTLTLGVMGRTTAWHFRAGQMGAGLALFGVTMVVLPLISGAVLVGAVLAMAGALLAHSYANSLFHGVSGSRRRARRMAVHEILLSAGLVVGGACGGLLYQAAGYGTACRAAAGVLGAAAAVALAFACRPGGLRRGGRSRAWPLQPAPSSGDPQAVPRA